MPQEVLKLAVSQGIWAVLFVFLLFYVLRNNEKRESKLQEIIDKLADKLGVLDRIRDDVDEIKINMRR